MTTNVHHDGVMRTVYFSLLAAIAVFVGMFVVDHLPSLGNSAQ
jgi:hypothetical protein